MHGGEPLDDAAWLQRFPELDLLIPSEALQARVAALGAHIAHDYAQHPPLLVGVLKGSLLFLADLLRAIPLRVCYDLVAISSYGAETHSSGQVRLLKDLDSPIQNRHVLVVEDIYDTGLTLSYLLEQLRQREPLSLRVCTLLSKPARRQVEIPIAYCGFEIPDHFVVGYGLDYNETYRNLPFIAVLNG
ncbi:MAG: hypoxanthine phosphoribosyltransferase [Fimbriimonadales bacterium]|nr:MAG: hypoxanthine phosphoribosyltransferase [Fimbriimonadales bacterium]